MHVLGTPPAFVLSQDQTLQKKVDWLFASAAAPKALNDLRFSSRFVSFSFQGTRPLLKLASLQSCAEEPNSPEFTRRHRRKVAALKQLLCWFSSKNPASLHSLAGHKVATLVCFSVILPRNLTSSNSLASGRHRHKATVEPIGIEPMTSCVQSRRSPS